MYCLLANAISGATLHGLTGGGKIALLNGHYSAKRLFANSSAIAACLPANGRVDRWTSEPALSINTPARAYVYVLENCWFTGSLVHWFSLTSPNTPPQKKCPIIKISPPSIPSGVFRGSPAGRTHVNPTSKNVQLLRFHILFPIQHSQPTIPNPPSQTHHLQATISKAIISKPPSSIPILPLPYHTFSFPTRDHSPSPFLLSCSACSSWKARTTGFFTIQPSPSPCREGRSGSYEGRGGSALLSRHSHAPYQSPNKKPYDIQILPTELLRTRKQQFL